MAASDDMRPMGSQGGMVTAALPLQVASKELKTVELGMPADSQVVSYQYLTRARHSLAHVTLDELEERLQLPEEQLLPLEEGEEYENFLEARQSTYQHSPVSHSILRIMLRYTQKL